jgi:hypothetical protein
MDTVPTGDRDDSNSGPGWPFPRHPAWCVTEHCEPGEHAGRPVQINSLNGWEPLHLQLRQPRNPAGIPYVAITCDGAHITITIPMARAMTYSVRAMCKMAGDGA